MEELGGAVAAIEQGFQKAEIERSAYRSPGRSTRASGWWSGVNKFTTAQRGALPAAPGGPGARAGAGAPPGGAAGQPGRGRVPAPHRRAEEGRGGQPERARADARGAARPGHGRRGLRRAARRLGRLPATGSGLNRAGPMLMRSAPVMLPGRPHARLPGIRQRVAALRGGASHRNPTSKEAGHGHLVESVPRVRRWASSGSCSSSMRRAGCCARTPGR